MIKEPADLRKALAADRAVMAKWSDLTPVARRDFLMWIDGAKQAQTRQKRIDRTCDMLLEGKRRPCCFSVVPLDLYTALNAAPKAKAQWKGLSPDAKRDFIVWIDAAKDKVVRQRRIDGACTKIAAGKQRP